MAKFPEIDKLTPIWYQALESEFGVAVTASDPVIINDLYAARKAATDPRLETLMITKMQDGTFWIVKREVELEETSDGQ